MPDSLVDDEDHPTEAIPIPWSSADVSLDEFDPESVEVGGEVNPLQPNTTAPGLSDAADSADPFGHLTPGAELGGRYRLEKVLGRGASGVVFEASHLVIGKKVAVKCLYPQLREHPVQVERFFREARIAATVDHKNLIEVFDGGGLAEDDGETMFLVMELLHGETLGERLERGPIDVVQVVQLFSKIIEGVAAMHERGVVHRDLKPDNIFLTRTPGLELGEPKVLDFGISKLKEPGRGDLTALGTVMGTPFYMAPEQMMNAKDVDVRADVYSLGVMLYESISGELPYEGENVADVFTAAKAATYKSLRELTPLVTPRLSAVVARAMHVERSRRHADIRELGRALTSASARTVEMPGGPAPPGTSFELPLEELERDQEESTSIDVSAPPERDEPRSVPPRKIDELATRMIAAPPAPREVLPMWALAVMVSLAGLALLAAAVAIITLMI